ncbi:hypothetical protein [Carboxylicivirga marina]|uniref:Uncharacterized protein n=1 Tax=Carboxylicivirga marina TaxID=2800988 RepID=A0ABS1HLJ0_9BACT|nr:hypothetical protein [Carboxylicivirga marina]MBK3518476.1 hypothetical protein [Carboxylicivirga marina]
MTWTIKIVNFPKEVVFNLPQTETPEVLFYFINELDDTEKFIRMAHSLKLPKDNHTIVFFNKGRKDGVNRDSIIAPFKNKVYPEFKFKAPMLCSISDELSAFAMCLVK